jgi:hypothetical protein
MVEATISVSELKESEMMAMEFEENDTLVLLRGVPQAWLTRGLRVEGLATYYGERRAQRRLEQRRHELGQRLQAAMAREERTISRQQAALDAVAGSELMQGHIL